MAKKLANSHIIKLGIVTSDAAGTAAAYRAIFREGAVPASQAEEHPAFTIEPFSEYHGERVPDASLKVEHVYTDNFWFEILEPVGDAPSPWKDFLDAHGTSVCFASIHVDSGFDDEVAAMEENGFPTTWVQDKGYERYAYFDTADALGLLVEVKERLAK